MIGWNSTQVLSFCEETEARFNRYSLRTNISVVLKNSDTLHIQRNNFVTPNYF